MTDSIDQNQDKENKKFEEEYDRMTADEKIRFLDKNFKECLRCGSNFLSPEKVSLCSKCLKAEAPPRKTHKTFNNSDDIDYEQHQAFCEDMRGLFNRKKLKNIREEI
jgi:hypothetical protein